MAYKSSFLTTPTICSSPPGTWQQEYCPKLNFFYFWVSECESVAGSGGEDDDSRAGKEGDSSQDDQADMSAGAQIFGRQSQESRVTRDKCDERQE